MEKVLAMIIPFLTIQLAAEAAMEVDLLNPGCELREFIAVLQSDVPVKSDFEELRSNPFQRRPRRFEGTIYWHPVHGLSLEYSSPASTRINVDKEKITISKPGGPPRQLVVGEENAALGIFLKLFDWDAQWIADNFETEADFSGNVMELRLRPLDQQMRSRLNGIILQVGEKVLNSIELDLSGQKEILIRLSGQEIPWEADDATLAGRYDIKDEGN